LAIGGKLLKRMERERGIEPPYQAWESNVRLFIKD
jgi:hypothetical protein